MSLFSLADGNGELSKLEEVACATALYTDQVPIRGFRRQIVPPLEM
jgi:hypothetical protein